MKPDWPGKDLAGVHILRELPDADSLLTSIEYANRTGGRAVIVGGGYIGLETASCCVQNGLPTTMVFPNEYLMSSFMPRELGLQYEQFYVEKVQNSFQHVSDSDTRPSLVTGFACACVSVCAPCHRGSNSANYAR